MDAIRVLLVDDHLLFREGLRRICESAGGIVVAGEAGNGEEAVRLAKTLQPDIVLMDILMPVMDGVDATRAIVEQSPAIKVIMLTGSQQDRYVFEAVRAGACGYMPKSCDAERLVTTLRAAQRGETLVDQALATQLIEEFRRRSDLGTDAVGMQLSQGEMDVLLLVTRGADNREIARQLAISERTVANRLVVIFQKLQVANRTQAALQALRRGWAHLDDEPSDDLKT